LEEVRREDIELDGRKEDILLDGKRRKRKRGLKLEEQLTSVQPEEEQEHSTSMKNGLRIRRALCIAEAVS